jgi:hypothetical protein
MKFLFDLTLKVAVARVHHCPARLLIKKPNRVKNNADRAQTPQHLLLQLDYFSRRELSNEL